MNKEKPLNSPGPLGHHYGPVDHRLYSPVIPDKNNTYSKRLEPLQVGEEISLPCGSRVVVESVLKSESDVLSVNVHDSQISFARDFDDSMNILVLKDSIPVIIEILQRALLFK